MAENKIESSKDESFVSVVTVLNTENENSLISVKDIQQQLDASYTDYEIILVVQKSVERRKKYDIEELLKTTPCIRYLQLSADVNTDVVWSAGTENAIGEFVICFDLNNDPVSIIKDSVNLCKSGNDVVVGTVKEKTSIAYSIVRPLTGWLLKIVDYKLPKGATTFRCLSRRAVNAVMDTGMFYQQFFMQIQKTGYGFAELHYEPKKSKVMSKTLIGGIKTALRLMVFNTTVPLRIMSLLGLFGSFFAMLFSLYSFLLHFFRDDVVPGWTSTTFIISFFSTIQFVILAFITEYLGRILLEQSNATGYSIVYEKNSSVMVNLDRINVLENSENTKTNLVQTGRDR